MAAFVSPAFGLLGVRSGLETTTPLSTGWCAAAPVRRVRLQMADTRNEDPLPVSDAPQDFRPPKGTGSGTAFAIKVEAALNRFLEKYIKNAPKPALAVITRTLLYPTLWYNMWTQDPEPSSLRSWYTEGIVDGVVLGALPYVSLLPRLRDEVKITAVLNTVGEWNGNTNKYRSMGWKLLWLPTIDFTPPSLEDLEDGADFIHNEVSNAGKVYVHCKAGKGRSASMVMAYLIKYKGMRPIEAQKLMSEKRPQILGVLYLRQVIIDFAQKYNLADVPRTANSGTTN